MSKKKKSKETVTVKVQKDFAGHKKGDILEVSERKLRDSSRERKRKLIKKV